MQISSHAQTFDRAAPTYDRVGVDFFTTFGRSLVDRIDLAEGDSVLDVGTGRGAVLRPAAERVGPSGRAVGVDLAPTMVELTAAELTDLPQVRVRQADASDLPADLGLFDTVLSSLVLFFTEDPAATLRHWADHVRPGGQLGLVTFVEDPDDDMFRDLVRAELPAMVPASDDASGPSPFELVRDPRWLDDAVSTAGLQERSVETMRHATRFADVEQWWDWAWSHGMRGVLEQVPDDRHDRLKAAAAAQLDARRLPDGGLGLHVTVRFTIAERPGR